MIEICAEAFAVNDGLAVFEPIQISARRAIIEPIGFLRADAGTGIFHNAGAFANWRRREYTDSMNGRWANYQGHATNFARFRSSGNVEIELAQESPSAASYGS
jgi:hypothetical protein